MPWRFIPDSPLIWVAVLTVVSALAQLLSIALWSGHGGVHMIWFPGAVLVAIMLTSRAGLWPACTLGTLAGVAAIAVAGGLSAIDTLLVTAPVALTAIAFAGILRGYLRNRNVLSNMTTLSVFIGLTGVVSIVNGTCIRALSSYTPFRDTVLGSWGNIALAHALGYLLLVPAWINLIQSAIPLRQKRAFPLASLIGIAVIVLTLMGIWYRLGPRHDFQAALLLLPGPVVIYTLLRLRLTGACVLMLLVTIVAAHISLIGNGPFIGGGLRATTINVQLWALVMSTGLLYLSIFIDQRRAVQEALLKASSRVRTLAGRLIYAQESERASIARDLHDDLSQRLASASMMVSYMKRREPGSQASELASLQHQLLILSNDVRHISHHLHPNTLQHAGLQAALEGLCECHRRLRGPNIFLDASQYHGVIDHDSALCVYRVTQEALRNSVTHARASHIAVRLATETSTVVLSIEDDGIGFHPPETGGSNGNGLGLVSMNERVAMLGGRFSLFTDIGRGTRICVHLPTG